MKPTTGTAAANKTTPTTSSNYSKIPSSTNKAAGSSIMAPMGAPKRPSGLNANVPSSTVGSSAYPQRSDSRGKATTGAAVATNGMMGPSIAKASSNGPMENGLTLAEKKELEAARRTIARLEGDIVAKDKVIEK